MTNKTQSGILTKKTGSKIGREASAYFAPNYHLCQYYAENANLVTPHKRALFCTIRACNP